MLFKSFNASVLIFCMPAIYTSVYEKDKRVMRSVFKSARALGLSVGDVDVVMRERMKSLVLNLLHDDTHFIHDFLEKCPSGRFRTFKTRSSWGTDSFYRSMVLLLNDILF